MIAPSPNPQRGFTTLEIMIVVSVIAILSLLAMVATDRIRERSARSMILNNLRQFYQAKEFYFFEKGGADATSILVIERQGYARSSLKNALLSPRSLEANMGWHYMTDANPNEPTYAYRGVKPTGQAPTGEVIYYPGPPGSPALAGAQAGSKPGNPGANPAVITIGGTRPGFADMTDMNAGATGNTQSQNPAQPVITTPPAEPATPLPPAGFKAGSTPNAPWVMAAPVVLSPIREDMPRTLTQAELLRLVGATNPPSGTGTLGVSDVKVDPSAGTVAKQANGSWVFTPAANFHGSNLPLEVKVANAAGVTSATAHLDVTPVADAAVAKLSVVAEQQVMKFQADGTGAVMNQGNLQGGGPLSQLAVEFTVIGGPQVQTSGSHGATFISYATSRTENEFYVWKPEDLTVRIGGREYATGINTTLDTESHRYTVQWDSATGGLDVFVDGKVSKHLDNIAKGTTIPGDGKLVLAQDQDSYGGGFSPGDAFRGQIFNAAMARTKVDPAQLANNNLGSVLHGSNDLIIDIQAHGSGFIDTTGRHQIQTVGSIVSANVMVDTSIASPNPGSRLRLDTLISPPVDTSDTIISATLSGFATGTVISDGPLHVHTVSGPGDIINVRDWSVSTLTAQLPVNSRENMNVHLEVTTTDPDGRTTNTATSTAPVTFVSGPSH